MLVVADLINAVQLHPTRTRSCAHAPHARAGRRHAADRTVELTAHGATALAPPIMPLSLVVADSMDGALSLTARDDRHTPSTEILLAWRTRSSGARWTASRRAASTASRRSEELDSTATVVIVLSRHLFCLLSVGHPSLVCVPPARACLMHALPPAVRPSVSPHVPFGAVQRQVFCSKTWRVRVLFWFLYFGRALCWFVCFGRVL